MLPIGARATAAGVGHHRRVLTIKSAGALVFIFVAAACTASDVTATPQPLATTTVATSTATVALAMTSSTTSITVATPAGPCAVERQVTSYGVNDALGNGPVRVSTGNRSDPTWAQIFRSPEAPDWQLIKLYWLWEPPRPMTLRVSGARLSDSAPVTFLYADRAASKVVDLSKFRPGVEWEIGADALVIPGPGCYGIELTVDGVTDTVVIRAA
jgi:hypothetical protein